MSRGAPKRPMRLCNSNFATENQIARFFLSAGDRKGADRSNGAGEGAGKSSADDAKTEPSQLQLLWGVP